MASRRKPNRKFAVGESVILKWEVNELRKLDIENRLRSSPMLSRNIDSYPIEMNGFFVLHSEEGVGLIKEYTPVETAKMLTRWKSKRLTARVLDNDGPLYRVRVDQGGKKGYVYEHQLEKVRPATQHLLPLAAVKLLDAEERIREALVKEPRRKRAPVKHTKLK